MVCEAVDEFPQASVAVQVLVVVYPPLKQSLVVVTVEVNVTVPHPSVAVALTKTGTEVQVIVVAEGRAAITGGVTSCTLIV
jgi:hypothetical protein